MSSNENLQLPRILCLHGTGSNSTIFRFQSRALRYRLSGSFRLVFANAPFPSEAGPGVMPIYSEMGPYFRWVLSSPTPTGVEEPVAVEQIRCALEEAMVSDDQAGATGPWVGFLGFSEGGQISASLLYEKQRRSDAMTEGIPWKGHEGQGTHTKLWGQDWRFAVVMAGRTPLLSFSPGTKHLPLGKVSGPGPARRGAESRPPEDKVALYMPILSVYGLMDDEAASCSLFHKECCLAANSHLVEWDGDHRVPFRDPDVLQVVTKMREMAVSVGVAVGSDLE